MSFKGIKSVEVNGVAVLDDENDLTTTLVNNRECAFSYKDKGIVKGAHLKVRVMMEKLSLKNQSLVIFFQLGLPLMKILKLLTMKKFKYASQLVHVEQK